MPTAGNYERINSTSTIEDGCGDCISYHVENKASNTKGSPALIIAILTLSHLGCLIFGALVGHWATSGNLSISPAVHPLQQSMSINTTRAAAKYEVDGKEWGGTQCGNSTEEAKELGCVFDPLASNWYTPECFDGVVLAQWLADPVMNHTWFYDQNHTEALTFQEVNGGEWDIIYPLHNYHVAHCLYMWAKMHHALIHDMPIDENILDYGHTSHCIRRIMRAEQKKNNTVTMTQNFPFCRRTGWGALHVDT